LLLPPHIESLTDARRAKLIDAWVARGGGAPRAQESLKNQKAPGPTAPVKNPNAQPSQVGRLLAVLFLIVVVGGGGLAYQRSTGGSRAEKVTISNSDALSCDELKVNGEIAVCAMSSSLWQFNQQPSLQQRATATKQALAPRPVKSVLVLVDGNIKARL
jgi:hypothetical protein